jgi:hypothetical protein
VAESGYDQNLSFPYAPATGNEETKAVWQLGATLADWIGANDPRICRPCA